MKALWNLLPSNIQTAILNKIGGKIVSFNIVTLDSGGGSENVTFPEDFTGINGAPSTALVGKYKVVFIFLSRESSNSDGSPCCCVCEVDFDCCIWFVIDEVPFGIIVPLLSGVITIPLVKLCKKK